MLARLASMAALALVLAPAASADRFYFGTPERENKMTAGTPDFIEGVLLREKDGNYVIRVEGGEITVHEAMVYKVEKDGLTVAQIEAKEKARASALAAANTRRRELQAAEASVHRRGKAAEATAGRNAEQARELKVSVDFQGLLDGYTFRTYDPVLHRADLGGLRAVIEDYLRNQVEQAAHRR